MCVPVLAPNEQQPCDFYTTKSVGRDQVLDFGGEGSSEGGTYGKILLCRAQFSTGKGFGMHLRIRSTTRKLFPINRINERHARYLAIYICDP
jgi:hypothetical protein